MRNTHLIKWYSGYCKYCILIIQVLLLGSIFCILFSPYLNFTQIEFNKFINQLEVTVGINVGKQFHISNVQEWDRFLKKYTSFRNVTSSKAVSYIGVEVFCYFLKNNFLYAFIFVIPVICCILGMGYSFVYEDKNGSGKKEIFIFIPAINVLCEILLISKYSDFIYQEVINNFADTDMKTRTVMQSFINLMQFPFLGYGCFLFIMIQMVMIIAVFIWMNLDKKLAKKIKIGIKWLAGEYEGAFFPLSNEENITIGRNLEKCNIILRNKMIGEMHCNIQFDDQIFQYRMIDYSESGTFIGNGIRLPLNEEVFVKRGTIVIMADYMEKFQLL